MGHSLQEVRRAERGRRDPTNDLNLVAAQPKGLTEYVTLLNDFDLDRIRGQLVRVSSRIQIDLSYESNGIFTRSVELKVLIQEKNVLF